MTVPLLLTLPLLVGLLPGRPLARAAWVTARPRLAVALWHSLSVSVMSSVVLAGTALALPALPSPVASGLTGVVARCATALRAEYATPPSMLYGVAGAVLAIAVSGRLVWCTIATLRATHGTRREQRARLDLVGTSAGDESIVVVVDDRPAVYCLPGRRRRDGRIVISTGAVRRLARDQLALVLAHERGHLRQRHNRAAQVSEVLAAAFGFVPLFRHAVAQVPLLLEMAADDDALRSARRRTDGRADARSAGRWERAHALAALATSQPAAPAGALPAAGSSALARVARLSQPQGLGIARSGALATLVGLALTGPVLIAAAPALCAAAMELCSLVLPA